MLSEHNKINVWPKALSEHNKIYIYPKAVKIQQNPWFLFRLKPGVQAVGTQQNHRTQGCFKKQNKFNA